MHVLSADCISQHEQDLRRSPKGLSAFAEAERWVAVITGIPMESFDWSICRTAALEWRFIMDVVGAQMCCAALPLFSDAVCKPHTPACTSK